ncbi:MAG: hypothetical protein K0S78_3158, partial [Thermomicrobiales bacterium]|nr:hypothetical protein [Thermomicrobiales bacterium]
LTLEDGTAAELAVDVGDIVAGERSASLCEVEIELIDGSPRGLFDIAHALFPDGGLSFSRFSKAERGYLLAEQGLIEPPLAPRKAIAVVIDGDELAEQAALAILRECFDQIATNVLVARKLEAAEGPHQLRIGLRRLRCAFSVCAPILDSPEMARLNDEARWLAEETGRLRDIDVVADEIVRHEAEINIEETGLATLADALSARAAELRAHLRRTLAGARVQSFLLDLACFAETRGWLVPQDSAQATRLAAPVLDVAEPALRKRWKKVAKRAHGLEDLTVEQRHELRKDLKKLRYAVEFFSPLYPPKRVVPFLRRLKELQTVFGNLNDAATVKAILTGAGAPGAGEATAERAMGWVIGASQARAGMAWHGAKALWRNLEDVRPFWK